MKRTLYWAYGSNLNVRAMHRRCPDAVPVGPLIVDNAALVFRGVADVVTCMGALAQGGLWRISAADERALDRYEGVDSGLYSKEYLIARVDGKARRVLYYQMRVGGIMPPSEGYLDTIRQGYVDFGLDLDALNRAVMDSWERKDVTKHLAARHVRRGRPSLAYAPGIEVVDMADKAPRMRGAVIESEYGITTVQWANGVVSEMPTRRLRRAKAADVAATAN